VNCIVPCVDAVVLQNHLGKLRLVDVYGGHDDFGYSCEYFGFVDGFGEGIIF